MYSRKILKLQSYGRVRREMHLIVELLLMLFRNADQLILRHQEFEIGEGFQSSLICARHNELFLIVSQWYFQGLKDLPDRSFHNSRASKAVIP